MQIQFKNSQTRMPLERLFRLPVLAAGRDKNPNLTEMKALVYDYQVIPGTDKISVLISFYNESTDTEIENNNVDVVLSTLDLTNSKTAKKALNAAIIAHNGSYALKEKDIIWQTPDHMFPQESDGLNGYKSPQIDGKTVGNTTIFANNSGRDFLVTEWWLNPINVSGVGTAPVINIGTNPSTFNDIASAISLSFGTQAGKFTKKTPDNNQTLLADGDSLVCRVATAAILTTTYDFKVLVRGVYL